MDAREKNRTLADRIVLGALVALLLIGLWQGYGRWLLAAAGPHGS